jgi:type II secretory ATPase GspE/PulE/Tfp pilus assembly ATPase PilB-like protein
MDEVEAVGTILRDALSCKAREICFSADHRGAAIFFTTDDSLESYTHLSPVVCQKVRHYLKQMATIDLFKPPPQQGFSVYEVDGVECTLCVKTCKGSVYEDLVVQLTTL